MVYRPPPSTKNRLQASDFLENFDEFVSGVDLLPGKILLVGDFNIHYDMAFKSDVSRVAIVLTSAGLAQHHRCGHNIDLFITRHDDLLIMKYLIDRSILPKITI